MQNFECALKMSMCCKTNRYTTYEENFIFNLQLEMNCQYVVSVFQLIYLCHYSKSKWWDSFAAESKSSKLAVTEWLQKNQTAPIIDHHPQSKFLALKAQTAALLASARTEEEYLKIVQDIIQSQDRKTVLSQSSLSNSTSPAISTAYLNRFFGDENHQVF